MTKKTITVNETTLEEREKRKGITLRNQIEWIKRQLDYISFSSDYNLSLDIKKGEIYEFDWGINVNSEFSNRHYGVVLKDSGPTNPLVIVCPLKTKKKSNNMWPNKDLGIIESLNTEKETIAIINQTRAIDKLRLFSRSIIGDTDKLDGTPPKLDEKTTNEILTTYIKYISGVTVKIY